jgi:hypothetical protein
MASGVGKVRPLPDAWIPRLSTRALVIFRVPDQAVFVVQIVFTGRSKCPDCGYAFISASKVRRARTCRARTSPRIRTWGHMTFAQDPALFGERLRF